MSLAKKIKLDKGEQIVAVLHAFWLTFLWQYLLTFILLATDAFFSFWLFSNSWWGHSIFWLLLGSALYTGSHTWFFHKSNCVILTSERLVEIVRTSWWEEAITSVNYLDIKDVVARRRGLMANLANYGQIIIEIENSEYNVVINNIRQPGHLQKDILDKKRSAKENNYKQNTQPTFNQFLYSIPSLTESQLILIEKQVQDRLAHLNST